MDAAIEAHVEVVASNPERTLVDFHQWRYLSDESLALVVSKRARYEGVFTTIVDEGVRSGVSSADTDARIAVLSVPGALDRTAEWHSPAGPAGVAPPGLIVPGVRDRLFQMVVCIVGR